MLRYAAFVLFMFLCCIAGGQDCGALLDTTYGEHMNVVGNNVRNKKPTLYHVTKATTRDTVPAGVIVHRVGKRMYLWQPGGHRSFFTYNGQDTGFVMICHTPVHDNVLEFVFSDGTVHRHIMGLYYRYRNFLILLQGTRITPFPLFTGIRPFKKVRGDEMLLQKLQNIPLRQIRYSEVSYYTDEGIRVSRYAKPVVIDISEEEDIKMKQALQCLVASQ